MHWWEGWLVRGTPGGYEWQQSSPQLPQGLSPRPKSHECCELISGNNFPTICYFTLDFCAYMLLLRPEPRPDPGSFEEYTCVGWGNDREGRRKVTSWTDFWKASCTHFPVVPAKSLFFQVPVKCHFPVLHSLLIEHFLQKYQMPSSAIALTN